MNILIEVEIQDLDICYLENFITKLKDRKKEFMFVLDGSLKIIKWMNLKKLR